MPPGASAAGPTTAVPVRNERIDDYRFLESRLVPPAPPGARRAARGSQPVTQQQVLRNLTETKATCVVNRGSWGKRVLGYQRGWRDRCPGHSAGPAGSGLGQLDVDGQLC